MIYSVSAKVGMDLLYSLSLNMTIQNIRLYSDNNTGATGGRATEILVFPLRDLFLISP